MRTSSDTIKMAAPMERMEMKPEKICFPLRSGASLVKTSPIFSDDSKCLFVCSGSVIKVFSVRSGECIHELRGHRDYVTGLAIHPKNKLQLLSCSLDCRIIVWDYTDGIFIREIHLASRLHGIYTVQGKDKVYILRSDAHDVNKGELVEVVLSEKGRVVNPVLRNTYTTDCRKIAVDPQGAFIAYVHGRKLEWVFLDGKGQKFREKIEGSTEFTCIVSHPCQRCVCTGTSVGKIHTWYIKNDKLVFTTFHWHSLPVKTLCYTVQGSYLLSGGYECVLVKWHPDSGYKDYLPRLGAPLNHIVCSNDNLYYAVGHDDNVIQVISSNFVIKNVYQGLTRCYLEKQATDCFQAGMIYDPRSKALVLNGKPGHIQFYSVHEDKQLFNLDIVCQNYISSDAVDTPLAVTEVVSMDFDSHGDWLATLEYWNDRVMTPEMRLKFWQFNDRKQIFVLNTCVEAPHDSPVHSLKFRPLHPQSSPGTEHLVVTSSSDGKFKIWNLVDDTDIYRTNAKWTCEAVGFYRNMPAGQADFSEDGSLLAVVFGPTVTLWNPENNFLKTTLCKSSSQDPVRNVMFGRHDCSHYLITTTDRILTVWNLVSCGVEWSADTNIVCLARDPCTDCMAAFDNTKNLIVFRPSSPTPVFRADSVSNSNILCATFIPHNKKRSYEETTLSWQNRSELFYINQDQELLCVSFEKDSISERTKDDVISFEQNLPQSALSLIVGRHSNQEKGQEAKEKVDQKPNEKFTREMLSSAAHVQPSVMSLCRPFVQSLLISSHRLRNRRSKMEDSDDEDIADKIMPTQTESLDSGLDSDMETDGKVSQSTVTKNSMSKYDSDSDSDGLLHDSKRKNSIQTKTVEPVNSVSGKFEGIKMKLKEEPVSKQLMESISRSDLHWLGVHEDFDD